MWTGIALVAHLALVSPPEPEPEPYRPGRAEVQVPHAIPSLRLGAGPAFHPRQTPDTGVAIEARVGTVFMLPPMLALWPELGAGFELRRGLERAAATLDFNFGLPAFLYYGVGGQLGVEGHAVLSGFRHGPDLRFFQVGGVALLHHITHTPRRGIQHELHVLFSLDVMAIVVLAGRDSVVFPLSRSRSPRS